jgi:hypothetical protein
VQTQPQEVTDTAGLPAAGRDERVLDDAAVLDRLEASVPEDTVVMHPVETVLPEVLDPPLGLVRGVVAGLLLWGVAVLVGLVALKIL